MSDRGGGLGVAAVLGVFVPIAELRALMREVQHQQKQLAAMGVDDRSGGAVVTRLQIILSRPPWLSRAGDLGLSIRGETS